MRCLTFALTLVVSWVTLVCHSLNPTRLRVEYQEDAVGIDVTMPRFYWAVSFDNNQDSYSQRGDSQSAYEIKIYDVDNSSNLVVDSGKVSSNESTHVTIDSFKPESHKDYKWCVSIWNSSDIMQDTSPCGTFSMGLLNGESDWENAVWLGINDDTNSVNHYFTNEFRFVFDFTSDEILDIKKVRIYVATPNYYKAWLNDDELLEERELGYFTTFEESCYYDVIDCTSYLTKNAKNAENSKNAKNRNGRKTGNNNNGGAPAATTISNAFGIMLGQGWYSQSSINIGVPMFKVLIYISFNNNTSPKTFTTDATNWYTHEGPVRMNDIYIGEHYDSNYETPGWTSADYDYKSNDWVLATAVTNATLGTLYSSAIMPKIERVEAFSPVTITQPVDGVFVVDFGQNVAGFTRITIPGNNNKNSNITMIHSEQLYPNGTIQQIYSNSPMIAKYTLRGDGETEIYQPLFTYFGYQYVQITGFPGVLTTDDIVSYFIHSNFNTNSDISFGPSSVEDPSSNAQLLNRIQRMTRYASLSNWMNIPTDCPQRERRGWLGDAQLTAEVTIYNFDMAASYTKFMRDIRDAQNFANKDGAIPDCAPYYSHGALPGDPSWTAALIFITHWMYKYYGDRRIIEETYDNMKDAIKFLDTQMNSTYPGLLPVSVAHYGDWCAANPDGDSCAHKSVIINTYQYAKQAIYLSQMAKVIGKTNDSDYYYEKAVTSQKSLLKYYFDSSNGKGYFIDSTSNAPVATLQSLCLDLNVLNLTNNSDADITTTVAAMVNDVVITNTNHLSAGIVGVKYILRELCKAGYCDIAVNASILTNFPSFGYWDVNGATTLWERWQSTRYKASGSKNHIMFGTQGIWYYQHLAGIRLIEDDQDASINTVGWRRFLIDPYYNVTDFGIYTIDALVDTIIGDVTVNVDIKQTPEKQSNGDVSYMTLEVNVPVSAECMVYISRLATFGSDYVAINNWVVNESGKTIWEKSSFVDNGSKGVVSGKIKNDNVIEFEVQSGLYSFELLIAAAS